MKKWFSRRKTWVKGGIVGSAINILLFIFYLFIYFPFIAFFFNGELPEWALIPSMVTGHFFVFLSGFMVPYGFLCKFTESVCTGWVSDFQPGSVAWTMDGQAGYCVDITMTPTTFCSSLSSMVGFLGFAFVLLLLYFIIGAVVGIIIQKRQEHRRSLHE